MYVSTGAGIYKVEEELGLGSFYALSSTGLVLIGEGIDPAIELYAGGLVYTLEEVVETSSSSTLTSEVGYIGFRTSLTFQPSADSFAVRVNTMLSLRQEQVYKSFYAKTSDKIVLQLLADSSLMGPVSTSIICASPLMDSVHKIFEINCTIGFVSVGSVLLAMESRSDIQDFTSVSLIFKSVSVLEPAVTVSSEAGQEPYILCNGAPIEIISVTVSQDEKSVHWSAEVELANYEDYNTLTHLKAVSLVIGEDVYSMVVTSKHRDRRFGSTSFGVRMSSPTILLDAPYSIVGALTSKTWGTPTLAKDIATELLSDYPLEWDVVNWFIPVGRLSVSNESTLSVISKIAAAVGGRVLADKDGTLRVQYKNSIPVVDYSVDLVDSIFELSTIQDVVSINETEGESNKYNKIRIMDATPTSRSDVIEVGDSPLDIRVYPHPWRTSFVVDHTSTDCTISRTGVETSIEVEDIVEFRSGQASLQKPINSISSVEWLSKSLGTVSFNDYETTVTSAVAGWGVAKIVYTTRYVAYRISTPLSIVQLLVEDNE